jgi:autoinducer 2 (AI-2) kinase
MPDAPFGWTFDAEAFWHTVCNVTRSALTESSLAPEDIAAVGVTSQRLGVVVVDTSGGAIYAGPNIDARAFVEGLAIDATRASEVYEYCGKLPSLLLAPAKLQWLREHHPDDFSHALAVLSIADWVAYKLTGIFRAERTLSCDNGLASATTGKYDHTLLSNLDVRDTILPPLVSVPTIASEVTSNAGAAAGLRPGTPVVIAGADTQCALVAMGVEERGELGVVAGWSCPVQQVTALPAFDAQHRTWVSLHAIPDRWVIESSAADAGRSWRWWCEQLLPDDPACSEHAAAIAGEVPPGANDALAFLGTRAMNAGKMNANLGGLTMTTPVGPVARPQMLRAGIESIAYALRANVEQAQEVSGNSASRIAVGGGFTRTPFFAPMLASVLDSELDVAIDPEVSGRGAALLAARAIGVPEDSLVIESRRVAPHAPDVATYSRGYARWRHVGRALDAAMQEMP